MSEKCITSAGMGQTIDWGQKWSGDAACLCAIFGESINSQINQGDNFYILGYPRRVELRNLEHGKKRTYAFDGVVRPRGIVNGFSKKAALRMKKKVEDNLDDLRVFQTFTYPDEFFEGMTYAERVKATQEHFDLFKRRMIYYGWFGFWRKEPVKRKSGVFKGEVIFHYHAILSKIGISELSANWECPKLGVAWVDTMRLSGDILTKALKVSTDKKSYDYLVQFDLDSETQNYQSRTIVSRYVSKYIAKADREKLDPNVSIGRQWGKVGAVKQAVPVEIRLTEKQMVRFYRVCRGFYRSNVKKSDCKVNKKYLSQSQVPGFIFMLAENLTRCLKYVLEVSFNNPLEQTFADVPF